MKILKNRLLLSITLLLIFTGCGSSISLYDQHSYEQITSLKVDVLHMMDHATESIDKHRDEVNAVIKNLEKAREYELHRPKNSITAEMWTIILDPNKQSVGGFIQFWEKKSQASDTFTITYIDNKKKQISEHFDQIAELESKKIKSASLK